MSDYPLEGVYVCLFAWRQEGWEEEKEEEEEEKKEVNSNGYRTPL